MTVVCYEKKENTYPLTEEAELIYIPEFRGTVPRKRRLERLFVRLLRLSRGSFAAVSFMGRMNELNISTRLLDRAVVCERNSPLKREPERFPETVRTYLAADLTVFQSETVRRLFPEEVIKRSVILPNPVTVGCMAAEERKKRIVNIGRLVPQKDQLDLIRAFALFLPSHPGYTLSFYGEDSGSYGDEVKRECSALGIEESVLFHGNVKNIHESVMDAEMFVLSSIYEGLSNALLECMMMGIPVISTACEGSTDVIEDGVSGLLVPAEDPEALYSAMERLADDPVFREKLAEEGKRAAEPFRAPDAAAKWEEAVYSIPGRKRWLKR